MCWFRDCSAASRLLLHLLSLWIGSKGGLVIARNSHQHHHHAAWFKQTFLLLIWDRWWNPDLVEFFGAANTSLLPSGTNLTLIYMMLENCAVPSIPRISRILLQRNPIQVEQIRPLLKFSARDFQCCDSHCNRYHQKWEGKTHKYFHKKCD